MPPLSRRQFLAAGALGSACSWRGRDANLVQEAPGLAPSYWTTWGAQNFAVNAEMVHLALAEQDISGAAAQLTEERLFGHSGWAGAFDNCRRDLYLVFDLGWDLEPGTDLRLEPWHLGAHEVSTTKFPSCRGGPVERLRRLNELCQQAGWRGAGVFIPAEPHGDGRSGLAVNNAEAENQLRDRLRWSRDAGIGYWKVGSGRRDTPTYRQLISEMGLEEAPALVIEHTRACGPLNDEAYPGEAIVATRSGEFPRWGAGLLLQDNLRLAEFSNVLRTNQVTRRLSIATTLDRVASILAAAENRPNAPCLLNCGDEPYIAAVLGCTLGLERHPGWMDPHALGYNPRESHRRIGEVARAVRWQRMAPPFPVGLGGTVLDRERLTDSWQFREGEIPAAWVTGYPVRQSAPARVARNMPLPQASGPDRAFVIASLHPNDSVAVATLPRVTIDGGYSYPLADVTVTLEALRPLVGIFGRYRSLTLRTPALGTAPRLIAQDLAGDEPQDITDLVMVTATEVVIPGDVIHRVGLSAGSSGDISDPGMVLRLEI
ncbi:MAG: hypothetical protein KJZ84_06115 [Bryobacteraceae bacterium]|nr:hypothetical protein [Bryobacteraceae bacterium]